MNAGDGIPDDLDNDDNNDSMPDDWEIRCNLNPFKRMPLKTLTMMVHRRLKRHSANRAGSCLHHYTSDGNANATPGSESFDRIYGASPLFRQQWGTLAVVIAGNFYHPSGCHK